MSCSRSNNNNPLVFQPLFEEVEHLCRDFIWGSTADSKKCCLISWETICRPNEWGLGFRNLRLVDTCYMMKLGWEHIVNIEALWVKIVRAKYKCRGLLLPTVRCGTKASHIWRGMSNAWNLVEQNITWVIRNNQNIKFWQDSWVPGLGPLSEHASTILEHARNFFVSTYGSEEGWNWDSLRSLLPNHICQKIASLKPPSRDMKDFPIWHHSYDGFFSIKSAYRHLYKDISTGSSSFPYEKIWKWQGAARIQALLWKLAHGRLMTNVERRHRHMYDIDTCP